MAQQIQNDPIYSLDHLYIAGLNISVASTTVIAIAPGQARDSNDQIDMPVGFPNLEGITTPPPFGSSSVSVNFNPNALNPNASPSIPNPSYASPLFVNSAIVGANGLDQGVLAASSQYVVYLIGDSRNYLPTAGILSLYSNAFPLLPSGYDSYRLLGFATTDSSTHFLSASILNSSSSKSYYLQPESSVLAGGNATTFTAIDLSTPIPTTTDPYVIAILDVIFTPSVAGDTVQFRPTGSSATAGLVTVTGNNANVSQKNYVQVICGVASSKPEIDYKVTVSGDAVTVLVAGYMVSLS